MQADYVRTTLIKRRRFVNVILYNAAIFQGKTPYDDQTRAFLGDTAGWQGAQLILDDVNGLWGGLRVTVRGDGNAYVTMVDVSLAEQHFWLPLGVDRALAVLDLAAQQDLLAVPVSGRVPVPDETSTRLQVINAAGETRTVVRWAHDDPDTRFDVVREGLMALRNDMQDLGARRIGSIPALGADDPAPPRRTRDPEPPRPLRRRVASPGRARAGRCCRCRRRS